MSFHNNTQLIINNNIRGLNHLRNSYEKAVNDGNKKKQLDLLERIESFADRLSENADREFENVKKSYTPNSTNVPTVWAMFSKRGNARVTTLVKRLLKTETMDEFRAEWDNGRKFISLAGHEEVYDTAVREEVLGWIFDNNKVPFTEKGLCQ